MNPGAKAQAFGLPSSRTVHQSKNLSIQFFDHSFDDGKISPGGTEQRFADRKIRPGQGVFHPVRSAVNVAGVGLRIEGFGIIVP